MILNIFLCIIKKKNSGPRFKKKYHQYWLNTKNRNPIRKYVHLKYSNYGIYSFIKGKVTLQAFPKSKAHRKKHIVLLKSFFKNTFNDNSKQWTNVSQEFTWHILFTTFKEIVTQVLNFAVVVRVAHLLINLIAPLLDENQPSDIDLRISHVNFHIWMDEKRMLLLIENVYWQESHDILKLSTLSKAFHVLQHSFFWYFIQKFAKSNFWFVKIIIITAILCL